jgi:hypothetical protein
MRNPSQGVFDAAMENMKTYNLVKAKDGADGLERRFTSLHDVTTSPRVEPGKCLVNRFE